MIIFYDIPIRAFPSKLDKCLIRAYIEYQHDRQYKLI